MATCDPSTTISAEDISGLKADITTIDTVVESSELTTTTKNGVVIDTLAGRLLQLGYLPPVTYAAGITFSDQNDLIKTVERNGVVYGPLGSAIPFTTSGTWAGDDENKFYVVQQAIVYRVASVAVLRAQPAGFTDWVELQGYYGIGTPGEGPVYWDAASTDTDDGGITFLPDGHVGAGRWKRSFNGAVHSEYYGMGSSRTAAENQTSLQNAINYAGLATGEGAKVVIAQGTYQINGPVTLKSGLTIEGAGYPILQVQNSLVSLFSISGTTRDVLISRVIMEGVGNDWDNLDNESAVNLGADVATNVTIEKCTIRKFKTGVYRAGVAAAAGVYVTGSLIAQFSRSAVQLRGITGVWVSGCSVDGDRTGVGNSISGDVGVWVPQGADGAGVDGVSAHITDNSVSNTSIEGINVHSSLSTIVGNTVTEAGGYGIILEASRGSVDDGGGKDCVISANTVFNAQGGIRVSRDPANASFAPERINVSSNTIRGITVGSGISIGFGGASELTKNVLVHGNSLYEGSTVVGISAANSPGVVISENLVDGFLAGVSLFTGAGGSASGVVRGNTLRSMGSIGIDVGAGVDGAEICYNTIVGVDLNGGGDKDGIQLASGVLNSSVYFNTVDGTSAGSMRDAVRSSGTGCWVYENTQRNGSGEVYREVTIATGAITIVKDQHRVDTEANAAADNLEVINGGLFVGQRVVLKLENPGRVVTVVNTGNIRTASSLIFASTDDVLELEFDGTNWLVVSFKLN